MTYKLVDGALEHADGCECEKLRWVQRMKFFHFKKVDIESSPGFRDFTIARIYYEQWLFNGAKSLDSNINTRVKLITASGYR